MRVPHLKLPHTDLEVSRLCFGTMTFGKPLDQLDSTRLIDRCMDVGINFFDSANMYQLGVAETMTELGTVAPAFELVDVVSGRAVGRDEVADGRGLLVMFICVHCPYVKHVEQELALIGADYQGK